MIRIPSQIIRSIYFLLFFISGATGLMYESIWSHYIKLFLGHSSYAQTLVICIFMGGLGLGAYLASRWSRVGINLLLVYAAIEAIIGLSGFAFHSIFDAFIWFSYDHIIPYLPGATSVSIYKWISSTLLILPQSILLGATFPLMSAGLIRLLPERPGASLSMLYFSNSLGAALGVLVSGFVLIDAFGLPGTMIAAATLNLLLAISVALLAWKFTAVSETEATSQATPNNLNSPLEDSILGNSKPKLITQSLFLCAGLTGLASFMYEMGWIRMLSMVLGSSTHAFEMMLSAFITGLALGGLWIRHRIDQFTNPLKTLGIIQILMSGFAILTLILYNASFDWMSFTISALAKNDQGYTLFNLSSHIIALVIMLPTTFMAGMTLPLITHTLMKIQGSDRAIGRVYAINTLGSILGVIIAIQCVMPLLGLKMVIVIGAMIDLALGIYLWKFLNTNRSSHRIYIAAALSISFIIVVSQIQFDLSKMASGVYRFGKINETTSLFHKDGKTASIDVISAPGIREIKTNGKTDAAISITDKPTPDETTMILLGALPIAHHPNANNAAVVGAGSGMSSHVLLSNPNLEYVDTIEIEPAIIEGAHFFGNRVDNLFSDPRSHIHIEDAKTYFSTQQKKYDIIVSEPSNPWVSGVAGLFSEEYYRLILNHLSINGVFVQWIQGYESNMDIFSSILKAMSNNFGDYKVYVSVDMDIIIVAQKNGPIGQASQDLFKFPSLVKELKRIDIHHSDDLKMHYFANKAVLQPLFDAHPLPANSDYYPVVDLHAVKPRFLHQNLIDFTRLRVYSSPIIPMLQTIKRDESYLSDRSAVSHPETPTTFKKFALQSEKLIQYLNWFFVQEKKPTVAAGVNTQQTIMELRLNRRNCNPQSIRDSWLPNLREFLHAVLPYIQLGKTKESELNALWQSIESSECFLVLPVEIKNWIYFYKALSEHDFLSIYLHGEKILNHNPELPWRLRKVILSSVITATIANNDSNKASKLISLWPSSERHSLIYILLNSHVRPFDI